jgi:hypothetical protein
MEQIIQDEDDNIEQHSLNQILSDMCEDNVVAQSIASMNYSN